MKVLDQRSIPEERLSTTDEKGWRVYLFPAAVQGFWRNRRTLVQVILIAIFLIAPWIKIGGHQMILLDIPRRQFALFGLTFWAHDIPIFFFVLLIFGVGLAFVTAIWGRVWCGWACPQTVFIDGVFRRIERLTVGSHLEQQALTKAPWSFTKFRKLGLKWLLFVATCLVISHSFLAYFVGADNLPHMIASDPRENWISFLVMAFVTGAILFDFGWFREQFCIIMCPYGRFQSVLLDKNSLSVMYDEKRGEPRKSAGVPADKQGDCVNCFRCVSACPTGIDIRRGVQMECIACTACIDACDDVMTKLNKPKGLIRYDSYVGMVEKAVRKVVSPRLFFYLALMTFGVVGLSWAITHRAPFDATVLLGRDVPFQEMTDGSGEVLNHFKLHIKNHEFHDVEISFKFEAPETQSFKLVAPINPITLKPGELQRVPFFVRFPRGMTAGSGKYKTKMTFRSSLGAVVESDVTVNGPAQ